MNKFIDRGLSFETLSDLSAYLESSGISEVKRDSSIIVPNGTVVFFATCRNGRGLLIPVAESWAAEVDTSGNTTGLRAVEVDTVEDAGGHSLRVRLLDPDLLLTFGAFLDHLLGKLARNGDDAGRTAVNELTSWKALFRSAYNSVPSVEAQVGLVLELETLLAFIRRDGVSVLDRWTGPAGTRHDFEFPGRSVECKATLARETLAIDIHGAHQLEPAGDRPLDLVVRRYETDPDGRASVPELAAQVMSTEGLDREVFLRKLSEAGVPVESLDEPGLYTRFNDLLDLEYTVVEDFPRVDPSTLDPRIGTVRYSVDLTDPATVPGYREPTLLSHGGRR